MKIRVIALPDEIQQAVDLLAEVFDVIEISNPYPCRGTNRNVRIYAEVRLR